MQVYSTITIADTVLDFIMGDENEVRWIATDMLTRESISGSVDAKNTDLFFKAVYIALSGDDTSISTAKYEEMERLLGFTNENSRHPARWIP
jgi:hypothetical protein